MLMHMFNPQIMISQLEKADLWTEKMKKWKWNKSIWHYLHGLFHLPAIKYICCRQQWCVRTSIKTVRVRVFIASATLLKPLKIAWMYVLYLVKPQLLNVSCFFFSWIPEWVSKSVFEKSFVLHKVLLTQSNFRVCLQQNKGTLSLWNALFYVFVQFSPNL